MTNFPTLPTGKHRRVMTKHFTNLALWLNPYEVAMINWLCYQAKADNTLKVSPHLLEQFSMSVHYCEGYYGNESNKPIIISRCRRTIVQLINKGILMLSGRRSVLMINPMLTYVTDVISVKGYNEFQVMYQKASADEVVKYFSNLVKRFLESKKKNYTYGKRK